MTTATQQTGTIKRLNVERGFGFIQPAGGGSTIFFHVKHIDSSLEWGESLVELPVTFTVRETPKGMQAFDVRAAE